MYSTKNGEAEYADDVLLNLKYWRAKEGVPVTISTGFRVWEEIDSPEYESAVDASNVQYSLYGFGIEKPVDEDELYLEDDDDEDGGI